jgi:hypothetical protein
MKNHEPTIANWEVLYTTAVLEHDRAKFLPKAVAALDAISGRLCQIPASMYDSEERKALLDAHRNIEVLLSQEADLPRSPIEQ